MLAKTGKLWWLVIVCAFLAGMIAYPLVNQLWESSTSFGGKQMYVGRTTLTESLGPPMKDEEHYYQMRMMNLGNLATGQAVMSNVAQTLSELGMKFTPQQVLSGTSITPIKDTNILAIEVTLPDPKQAKVATDVIAAELKKVYSDRQSTPLSNRREFYYVWSKNAASTLAAALNAVRAYKRTHVASAHDAELAKLEADAAVAKDSYMSTKKKLADGAMEEQQARNDIALKTIDPAYVHQLERPNPARMLFVLLFSPIGGPIIGVIVGLVLGLALAALIRKRRANCPSPQQGV